MMSSPVFNGGAAPGLPPFGMRAEKVPPALAAMIDGFGDRLLAAILAKNHTQASFARLLGIGTDRLNHWIKGKHPPGPHYLALMKRHGIGADWILSGDYTALSVPVLQGMINLGARPDAPEPARELRQTLPDVPDPGRPPGTTLHEPPPLPPTRTIRHRDV